MKIKNIIIGVLIFFTVASAVNAALTTAHCDPGEHMCVHGACCTPGGVTCENGCPKVNSMRMAINFSLICCAN